MHKARFALPPLDPIPPGTDLSRPALCFVSLPRDAVTLRGNYEAQIRQFLPAETVAAVNFNTHVVMPVHPHQLPNVYARFPHATLLPGRLASHAQASLRTVSLDDHPDWAIKLCLGVKVSSGTRTVTPWTTYMGPGMQNLLKKLVSDNADTVCVLNEVASAVVKHPDIYVARHLSCIIRYSKDSEQ
jgi:siderophore synthetase component